METRWWSVRRREAQRGRPFLNFSPELASEATAGIEPAMKVLQTSALPLGYVAEEPQERASSLSVATTATRREAPYVAADNTKSTDSRPLTLF